MLDGQRVVTFSDTVGFAVSTGTSCHRVGAVGTGGDIHIGNPRGP
jgi:hypothetical protein